MSNLPEGTPEQDPNEISFDNTEIAFASRSNQDLRKAFLLFQGLAHPSLVKGGKYATQLAFGLHIPIDPLIRQTLFRQFVGGESIEACESMIQELAKYSIGSILDYSSEGKETEASFDHTLEEILAILDKASLDPRIPFSVFKVTGLARTQLLQRSSNWGSLDAAEQTELKRVEARIDTICQRAVAVKTPVFIDAEETWIQPVIDRLALKMMRRYNLNKAWVWNTLQLYRNDRLDYLQDLLGLAHQEGFFLGVKLVRGAYMEKERKQALNQGLSSPIQRSKAATDQAFDQAVTFCLEHLEKISFCAGSHNENSNYHLLNAMNVGGFAQNDPRIWFAQLLGMSDHISYNLAQAGYNVVKYVPYAPIQDLLPYLMRRAEENTSVRGQSGRELTLLKREMKRRGLF